MGSQSPELEDMEQNEDPIVQRRKGQKPYTHLRHIQVYGADRIHPRVLRELAEILTKSLPIFSSHPV